MAEFAADVTVVGCGIAGLWTAKSLIEEGYRVNLVEKGSSIASGSTVRNEGWLHAGTYHAAAIVNEHDAKSVTERTIYGHESFLDFAPEAVECDMSYAFTKSSELAHVALGRWDMTGVEYSEVSKSAFSGTGLDIDRIHAAFQVRDKSINSVEVCRKLARFIVDRGGRFFTRAEFLPVDSNNADIRIDDEVHSLHSSVFVITSGIGTKDIFEQISQKPFPIRYFKSHLLISQRLTDSNFFYLEKHEPGIMSHGHASIIGINHEAVGVNGEAMNCDTNPETERFLYSSLIRMLPLAGKSDLGIRGVACLKLDITKSLEDARADLNTVIQDLNIKVFEPVENYICAVPGKMTEAPALARAVVDYVQSSRQGELAAGCRKKLLLNANTLAMPTVAMRPIDGLK